MSRTYALDCETWPTLGRVPGACAPRLVCVSFDGPEPSSPQRLYHRDDPRWIDEFATSLGDRDAWLVNQNIGFDFGVLLAELQRRKHPHARAFTRAVFDKYDAGRIGDTMVASMLIAIALGEPMAKGSREAQKLGGFGLGDNVKRWLGEDVEGKSGDDVWRMRYHELDAVPVEQWPAAAREYALLDPNYARRLWFAMRRALGGDPGQLMLGEQRNVRAAFALTLSEFWGVRTDPRYVHALKQRLMRERSRAYGRIREVAGPVDEGVDPSASGWLRPDGSQYVKGFHARIVDAWAALGDEAPRNAPTEKAKAKAAEQGVEALGSVKGDRDTLVDLVARSPVVKLPDGSPKLDDEGAPISVLEDLDLWTQIGGLKTDLQTFVPRAEDGVALPINARWNVLVESERLSCRNPNLTNQPNRDFDLADEVFDPDVRELANELRARGLSTRIGVRSCFVPRDGFVFIASDYSTAEMRGFAQIAYRWFGHSTMRDTLIAEAHAKAAGVPAVDLHMRFAAKIMQVTEAEYLRLYFAGDKFAKLCRQLAKRVNFGMLGGMGAKRFALTARKDRVDLTLGGRLGSDPLAVAQRLRALWLDTWPEVKRYFERINEILRASGGERARVTSWGDGITRGNVKYTDLCNHYFQNIVAQMIKTAQYRLTREAYVDDASAYFGCRPVIVPHDEIIAEAPAHRAHEAAHRQSAVMLAVAEEIAPDVPHACEPAIMTRWHKGAEPVYTPSGRLTAWEPRA